MKLQFLGFLLLFGVKMMRMEEAADDTENCVVKSVKLWKGPQGIDGDVVVTKKAKGSCPKKRKNKSFTASQAIELTESIEMTLKDGNSDYEFGDELDLVIDGNVFVDKGRTIKLAKESDAENTYKAEITKEKHGNAGLTYKAPGAVLYLIHHYRYNTNTDMKADVSVKCGDDDVKVVQTTMGVKATMYGPKKTVLHKGEYYPDACDNVFKNCINTINNYALDDKTAYEVTTGFKKCFSKEDTIRFH